MNDQQQRVYVQANGGINMGFLESLEQAWEFVKATVTLDMDKGVAVVLIIAFLFLVFTLWSIQYLTCSPNSPVSWGACLKTFCWWGLGWC